MPAAAGGEPADFDDSDFDDSDFDADAGAGFPEDDLPSAEAVPDAPASDPLRSDPPGSADPVRLSPSESALAEPLFAFSRLSLR